MKKERIDFDISLPIYSKLKHLKEKSCYDHNYYELKPYGDWVDFGDDNNNILREEYSEMENCYTYTFGRFEQGKFISVFGYTTTTSALVGIEMEEGK